MTIAENIHQYIQRLPDPLQRDELDFVRFLLFKQEQEIVLEQDEIEWANFSLASTMRDMEDEDSLIYTVVEQKVTYILELEGQFIIIENVPARVNEETGEQYFSPEVVEKLQQTIWGEKKPHRVIETPVFEFTA